MKPLRKIHVLLVLAFAFAVSAWWSSGSLGVQSACANSQCAVRASSSPIALAVAVALIVFLFAYRQHQYAPNDHAPVGVWRRLGAFFVDFATIMLMFSPIGAMPALLGEAHFTGEFHWAFERDFGRPSDAPLVVPAVLVGFLCLFVYFYAHARMGRQTLGQYLLSYRLEGAGGAAEPAYGRRTVLSFIGLCAWPISLVLALRNPRKAFWWDGATDSKVIRVGS